MHNNHRFGWAVTFVFALLFFLHPAAAAGAAIHSDYTDISIYNFAVSDDFDTITFDLTRRIPTSEQFMVQIALFRETGEKVFATHGILDGGQHVTLSGMAQPLAKLAYGSYDMYFRVCPAFNPYEGVGIVSGCGVGKTFPLPYYPWKLTSGKSLDGKSIVVTPGNTFTVAAKPPRGSTDIPQLKALFWTGEDTEDVSCTQIRTQQPEWTCTVHAKEETAVKLMLMNGETILSNALVVAVFSKDRMEAARFVTYCQMLFTGQEGNRYSYRIVRNDTREDDPLCQNATFSAHAPARIQSSTKNTVVVEAPPTDNFALFAEKGDGSGPRHLLTENDSILAGLTCQVLVKQDAETITFLMRNLEGLPVSSCSFTSLSFRPVSGDTRIITRSTDRIVLDATKPSIIEMQSLHMPFFSPVDHDRLGDPGMEEREDTRSALPLGQFTIVPGKTASSGTAHRKTASGFPDVPDSHIHTTAITYVKEQGIVGGYSDGMFRPDDTINRAEFTKIIAGSLFSEQEIAACSDGHFRDTAKGEWYVPFLCKARAEGLIEGYPDGTFRPEDAVTFVEAAKIIVRGFRIPMETQESDIWFLPYTDTLAGRKVIPQSIASLDEEITRGEMAEMVYRIHTGDTVRPTNDYEELLDKSGVLQQLYESRDTFQWTGTDVPVEKILRMRNLKTLVLNYPGEDHISEEFINLPHLESLIVYSPVLENLPSNIAAWPRLKKLAVWGGYDSPFTIPEDIDSVRNLEELRVNNHRFTSIPASVGNLRKLRLLHLNGNQLISLPTEIGNLTQLTELELEWNPITQWPDSLRKLAKLERMVISRNIPLEQQQFLQQLLPHVDIRPF